jgi:hypothetical protein
MWHVIGMCGWRRICSSKMVSFIGMFCLFNLCMIRKWLWFHVSLSCCIPKKLGMKVRLQFDR